MHDLRASRDAVRNHQGLPRNHFCGRHLVIEIDLNHDTAVDPGVGTWNTDTSSASRVAATTNTSPTASEGKAQEACSLSLHSLPFQYSSSSNIQPPTGTSQLSPVSFCCSVVPPDGTLMRFRPLLRSTSTMLQTRQKGTSAIDQGQTSTPSTPSPISDL